MQATVWIPPLLVLPQNSRRRMTRGNSMVYPSSPFEGFSKNLKIILKITFSHKLCMKYVNGTHKTIRRL